MNLLFIVCLIKDSILLSIGLNIFFLLCLFVVDIFLMIWLLMVFDMMFFYSGVGVNKDVKMLLIEDIMFCMCWMKLCFFGLVCELKYFKCMLFIFWIFFVLMLLKLIVSSVSSRNVNTLNRVFLLFNVFIVFLSVNFISL